MLGSLTLVSILSNLRGAILEAVGPSPECQSRGESRWALQGQPPLRSVSTRDFRPFLLDLLIIQEKLETRTAM